MATSVKFSMPKSKALAHKVSAHSALLMLTLADGEQVKGYYQKWLTDVNAEHIMAKKGDSFFYSPDNVLIENVVSWEYVDESETTPDDSGDTQ